jgi:hypothetical protein
VIFATLKMISQLANHVQSRQLELVLSQMLAQIDKLMTLVTPQRIKNQAMLTLTSLF